MGRLLEGLKKRLEEGGQTRMIRRAQLAEVKQKHKKIFAAEYAKASEEQIKRKARMEASQQFRTTQEKTQDLFKAFGSLAGKPPQKKEIILQKKTQKKTQKKAHDPFDINLDLGFDF